MQLHFILQPRVSTMGSMIENLLRSRNPFFSKIWFISAFVNQLGVVRLRSAIEKSLSDGAKVHFIIGIDVHSTTIEALREILSFNVDCRIVKNKNPRNTFHPKIYLFEAPNQRAELFLGSSNLTEGGIYRNYEANIQISYDIGGNDKTLYAEHRRLLDPFLNPSGPTVKDLTNDLITVLIERGDVISERRKREARDKLRKSVAPRRRLPPSPFGAEHIPTPPLPSDYLSALMKSRRRRKPTTFVEVEIPTVNAFYIHLSKLQAPKIPGEARIPLAARDIAPDFWGWPNQYKERIEYRGKRPRHYKEWKSRWRILDADNPSIHYVENVRMYEYKESADFRFFSPRLVKMGADKLDIVRVTRPDSDEYEFQCELAKRGSKTHGQWGSFCTQPIRNSPRKFGYA